MMLLESSAYIRREMLISVAINAALSVLFFFLVFGGVKSVPLWGVGGWVLDFIPQSFMIALMSTFVPGVLAAKRVRAGLVLPHTGRSLLPRSLVLRAILMACLTAVGGTVIVAGMIAAGGLDRLPFAFAGALKVAYGGLLAALVTPPTLRAALRVGSSYS